MAKPGRMRTIQLLDDKEGEEDEDEQEEEDHNNECGVTRSCRMFRINNDAPLPTRHKSVIQRLERAPSVSKGILQFSLRLTNPTNKTLNSTPQTLNTKSYEGLGSLFFDFFPLNPNANFQNQGVTIQYKPELWRHPKRNYKL